VRGLKFRTRSIIYILGSETLTGALIGTALGLLAFVAVWLMFDNAALAAGVGLALMVAATIASVVGLALPWILERTGIDPAFGSGPIATIIQDVLTIIVYFYIMTTLLEL
jgi:magnesium transporter